MQLVGRACSHPTECWWGCSYGASAEVTRLSCIQSLELLQSRKAGVGIDVAVEPIATFLSALLNAQMQRQKPCVNETWETLPLCLGKCEAPRESNELLALSAKSGCKEAYFAQMTDHIFI